MKLPDFSVKQPVATVMLFLALAMIGGYSLLELSVDMFPKIEPPTITVLTSWPGASASDVESEITEKIENSVKSVNNLDTLTSKSLDNLSIVSCDFKWGADLDSASNDIRDKLEFAKKEMPDDADTPVLFKFNSSMAPILALTVNADKSWPMLYHLVDEKISDTIKRVPGVGSTVLSGGMKRRINIYFNVAKVEGFSLSLQKINAILGAENVNVPAGKIKYGLKSRFLRIPAKFKTIEEIQNTVIGSYNKRPVYLKNVADVKDDFQEMEENAWGDGKPAVIVLIQKQTGANTVEVIENIKKEISKLQKDLPVDVKIHCLMDSSEDILNAVNNLKATVFSGIIFIILVTMFFLRKIRTVFIIILMIPASLVISFIMLNSFGYTINAISLMALAIASGMVVDNGIVVLENIISHIEKGKSPSEAAVDGTAEMGLAITASTMTTIVVFIPLIFLSGIAGILFKQLGFVVVVTLTASLLTALMLTPMLASRWISSESENQHKGISGKLYMISEKWFQAVEDKYSQILDWALAHRKTVICLAVSIFASGISLVPLLSTTFMPEADTGSVAVTFRMAEGTRIEETTKVIEKIQSEIDSILNPGEFRHSYAKDGEDDKGFAASLGFEQGPNVGDIRMKIIDKDKRDRSAKDVASLLREKVEKIPGIARIQVSAQSAVTSALLGGGKPVSLEIQGADLEANLAFAKLVEKELKSIPGLVAVNITQKDPRPEIRVEIDRKKAADLGLNAGPVAMTLRNYFYGVKAAEFSDSGSSFDIFTRFSTKDKDNLGTLSRVPVFTPDGRKISIGTIAEIVEGVGPIEIERKNRQRIVKVEAGIYQRALGEVSADIKERLKKIGKPPGISISFGGDVEEQNKAFKDLGILLVMGIILVYMVMASLFGNLRDPFIVMFSVPFAFTGVLYAYYFSGTDLGIISFMGIVMLMGIVVNNAIVLLDYTHQLRRKGVELKKAIKDAGKSRLRPVLMTTLTTFFGMFPMAITDAVGSETWNPLGITMLGGLSVSTLVTLILIPVVFYFFEKTKTNGEIKDA